MFPNLRRRGDVPWPTSCRNGFSPGRALGVVAMAAGLLTCGPLGARAVTVTVPDDWPTIQQAIDSGADEVLVRPGVYPETLVVDRELNLKGIVRENAPLDSLPRVVGLVLEDFQLPFGTWRTTYLRLWNLRFESTVHNDFDTAPFSDPLEIEFSHCGLEYGLSDERATAGGQIEYYIRGCWIERPVRLGYPQRAEFHWNRIRAPIGLGPWPHQWHSSIDVSEFGNNQFSGPSAGIDVSSGGDYVELYRNRFEGCRNPVRNSRVASLEAYANTFIGPGSVAIECANRRDLISYRNAIVGFERGVVCDGGELWSRDNRIEDCGVGIDVRAGYYSESRRDTIIACGTGARVTASDWFELEGAVVQDCRDDGIVLQFGVGRVHSNIVGRCGGDGIRVAVDFAGSWLNAPIELTGNTSHSNGGSGYVVSVAGTTRPAEARRNIAFGNGRHGLEVLGEHPIVSECNDWFANVAGPVSGAEPGATDLALDPLFCDVAQGDVHLSVLSPIVNAAGCGQIGALGLGCERPVVSRLISFTVAPTIEGIEVRWQVADSAPGFVAWVERADRADGPFARVDCQRATDGEMTLDIDRSAMPARSYWYRLVATDRGATRVLGDAIRVDTDPPTRFALLGTGPNPTPGTLAAAFQLAHAADIALEVFDAQGRRVASLARGTWPAGIHRATWDEGRTAPAGLYLLRYRYPGGEARRRIVLVR